MKIVFLAPFGIRPKGTVIARMLPLAVELQKLGHQVVIVAPPYTNPEDSGRTEIVRGVKLLNVSLGPRHKALAAPFLAWRMFRAALKENPDLVHLFKPKGYGGLAAMLMVCCERLGIRMPRLFLDTDDWEGKGGMNDLVGYSGAEQRLYAVQEAWLPPRCSGVTVASRMLEQQVLAMGVPPQRVLYLPNCVEDLPPVSGAGVRERLGIPAAAPVVLLYTRFFEFDQARLHRILAQVSRGVPEARFLVVGKGRHGEEQQLIEASRTLGFASKLLVAGWIEPVDLPAYLAAGDVALYPFEDNLVNRAKCPAKFTELLRAGIPVVADRVGQIPEYVAPELQGLLCDPSAEGEMAEKCLALLRDPEARARASVAGRTFLLTSYAWRDYAGLLHNFYVKVTDSAQR